MEVTSPAVDEVSELIPCGICGRTFRSDALARHQKVCEKNAAKKRKVFDSSKQRALEDAPQVPKQAVHKTKPAVQKPADKKPKTNWREKHEELIDTIKRARGQDDKSNESNQDKPVKKKIPSDYVQCPACERHFNQRAAERHIPWCQKKKSETPKSPATVEEAKEKLQARVKYRPPQGGKSRVVLRKSNTADSVVPPTDEKKQSPQVKPEPQRDKPEPQRDKREPRRDKNTRSSPPNLVDNRKPRNGSLDRLNNNVNHTHVRRRSGSRSREKISSREKEMSTSSPDLPLHIIKFKDRFPNRRNKRNMDFEESLTSEQFRELLSCSRITERIPRTVPGVRLSGGQLNRNDNWNYRSTDVSRSASSSGGSTNSNWNRRLVDKPTLPDVSSSELHRTWMGKTCWNGGDLDRSVGSTGSSSCSSNGSLPPLSREGNDDTATTTFYCHRCNSKFPLVAAKYCCECGAKRRANTVCINQTG